MLPAIFRVPGGTRKNLVGRCLEIRVMQNLAWLAGWPVKCSGWEGERKRLWRVSFITGSIFIFEAVRNTPSPFWVEEIRTQSSAFEKKEMGMYILGKQSYWSVSISRYIKQFRYEADQDMRNYADWGFYQEKMKANSDSSPPDQRRF